MPPRGPRSVLCVVVVTIVACGYGCGCAPATIRPAMCAMSATSTAPTASAILREARVVPRARIRRAAAKDQLRPRLARERLDAVQVDAMRLGVDLVLRRLVNDAREIHAPAVRQMAAERQAEAHDGIARLREREVHGLVRRRARVRLHVRVLHAEQALRTLDRERLDLIDVVLPFVVALARDSLRSICCSGSSPSLP